MNDQRLKYVLLVVMLVCGITAFAQVGSHVVQNRPYIDQRRFHYGFLAGINLQDLEFENNGHVDELGNQWYADVASYEPGFCVGILGEFYLTKHLAFRIVPTMHFGTKTVSFINHLNNEKQRQEVKTTYFSVPLDLKIAGERHNNYRPYAMAGITPAYNLTIKKQKNLLFKPMNLFLEVGMGCDFYLPYFKFIPEIKFMYGLSNMLDKKRSDLTDSSKLVFTNAVNRVASKMVVITFYFE